MTLYQGDQVAVYLRLAMDYHHIRSGRALARFLQLPRTTTARLLNGHTTSPETLAQVARALDVPLEALYRVAGYLPALPLLRVEKPGRLLPGSCH